MSRRLSYVLNILEIIMAIIKASALKTAIANVRKNKEAFRAEVQEVIVAVAYQACLGNANWANEILDAVRDTANIKGITMWLETYAPLIVSKGEFAINKGARKSMGVTDEASFAEYEVEMRKVGWWEMVAPQKATSIFAPDEYIEKAIERMAKKLNDEGQPDLAAAIQSLMPELYSSEAWKKYHEEQSALAALPAATV